MKSRGFLKLVVKSLEVEANCASDLTTIDEYQELRLYASIEVILDKGCQIAPLSFAQVGRGNTASGRDQFSKEAQQRPAQAIGIEGGCLGHVIEHTRDQTPQKTTRQIDGNTGAHTVLAREAMLEPAPDTDTGRDDRKDREQVGVRLREPLDQPLRERIRPMIEDNRQRHGARNG